MTSPRPVRLSVPEYRRRLANPDATDPQVKELAQVIADYMNANGDDGPPSSGYPTAFDSDLARHIIRRYREVRA